MASRDAEFSAFVAERWDRLVRTAVLLGCPRAEAEDIAQSTLEKCLLKWRQVQGADDTDAYVHRILINTLASSRRRRWNGERPTSRLPERAGRDETTRVDDADAILRALQQLPDSQRQTIVLRYYAHLTEGQMATALAVAPGTIKSRLSRALQALADNPNLTELREPR